MRKPWNKALVILSTAGLLWSTASAWAQIPGNGFQLNRYEPTAAGEYSVSVDHPWYSSTRYAAMGFTVGYAHNPLAYGDRSPADIFRSRPDAIIEHQLIGHVDLAFSFLDRVLLTASLPVTAYEWGTANYGISPKYGAVGDPRLGAAVRLFGQPYKGPFSVSIGAQVWLPAAYWAGYSFGPHIGESGVRVMPKLILGGLAKRVFWSATAGFLYRPDSVLGTVPGGESGNKGNYATSELQLGGALGYVGPSRFGLIAEVVFSTLVGTGQYADVPTPFYRNYSALETMLGLHYNVAGAVQMSLAGGVGFFREPGVPDGRVLLRIAYAPVRKPASVANAPTVVVKPVVQQPVLPPPPDADGDGVPDDKDVCPKQVPGANPDPDRPGCPLSDKDADGVPDVRDLCPDQAPGNVPDPRPERLGCPAVDSDRDGTFDHVDVCPQDPAGPFPDTNPARLGCPLPDIDKDGIPDVQDACPDKPGVPSLLPKQNGCPSKLVRTQGNQIVILQPVFFATGKNTVLPKSFPLLRAVAEVIKAMPGVEKVVVAGHTDDVGNPENNVKLSKDRADSVVASLVKFGVEPQKMVALGHGETMPKVPVSPELKRKEVAKQRLTPAEKKELSDARSQNRRVTFVVTGPGRDGLDVQVLPDSSPVPTPRQ